MFPSDPENQVSDEWLGEDDDRTRVFDGGEPSLSEQSHRHCLGVVRGDNPGTRFPIDHAALEVGRASDADIRLRDPEVSSHHCRLELDGKDLWVEDLGSTNGTFVDGARISDRRMVAVGSTFQVGGHLFLHELLTEAEVDRSEALREDLRAAAGYVRSQLPAPWRDGPIRTEWRFEPCASLGGDAFGYDRLADGRFRFYLLDVCGHGTGPAMHSVSVHHCLAQRAEQPPMDIADPAQVLDGLNRAFPMHRHAGMYFTIWYGVFDPTSRRLVFASGGHPPAFLIAGARDRVTHLQTANPGIGLLADVSFTSTETLVPPRAEIVLYSDGAYEFRLEEGGPEWTVEELTEVAQAPPQPGIPEPDRIHQQVLETAGRTSLDDDCSILCIHLD